MTSDGGVLLLREVDRHIGLSQSLSKGINDPRDAGKCTHSLLRLMRQQFLPTQNACLVGQSDALIALLYGLYIA